MIALPKPPAPSPSPPMFDAPVIGYRAWRVGRHGVLRSLTAGDYWGPGAKPALCTRPMHEGQRPHAAPAPRCVCGNHSTSSLKLARRAASSALWFGRWLYVIVIGALIVAAVTIGERPLWGARGQGAALLVLAIGTTIGAVRRERSIVYGAVLAWGDLALDAVRNGVQIRSQYARVIAIVQGPHADRAAATLGVPVAPARSIAVVAREVSDGQTIDPAIIARRGLLDWAGWGVAVVAIGLLHLVFMAVFAIARSIVFMATLGRRRRLP